MDTFTVTGPDISTAWIRACRNLLNIKSHRAYHTTVHIEDPSRDDPAVRTELDRILDTKNMDHVGTVANTIFPAALAQNAKSHDELVARYRAALPTIHRVHPSNRFGTYFERLIDYPGPKSSVDQVAAVIHRLRQQTRQSNPMTACYEANLVSPEADTVLELDAISAPVRVPGKDNGIMQFPCLSHCSFQLDRRGTVHLVALYRSHYMVQRAYGNYVGLGHLLAYVARNSGLSRGTLTVVAGYAQLDGNVLTSLRPLLRETPAMMAA